MVKVVCNTVLRLDCVTCNRCWIKRLQEDEKKQEVTQVAFDEFLYLVKCSKISSAQSEAASTLLSLA